MTSQVPDVFRLFRLVYKQVDSRGVLIEEYRKLEHPEHAQLAGHIPENGLQHFRRCAT